MNNHSSITTASIGTPRTRIQRMIIVRARIARGSSDWQPPVNRFASLWFESRIDLTFFTENSRSQTLIVGTLSFSFLARKVRGWVKLSHLCIRSIELIPNASKSDQS